MDFLSPKDFSISVVGASPCLDLLVKWFRAGGLAAVPCRTRDELQAGPCRVLVVEQNYNYSDGRTPPLGLARQLGASSCISFCASPLVGVQASQGPGRSDLPKGRLVFDSTRFREPEQAEFQVPDQLGRLILHLRGLTGVRAALPESQLLAIGSIVINPTTREVCTGRGEVALTALQFDLLEILVRSPGRVFSAHDLQDRLERLQTVRKDPSVVRYHVARLRSRLGGAGRIIENVRGCGYRAQHLLLG